MDIWIVRVEIAIKKAIYFEWVACKAVFKACSSSKVQDRRDIRSGYISIHLFLMQILEYHIKTLDGNAKMCIKKNCALNCFHAIKEKVH